ncbi:hypothetical protein PG997_005463 [Apiospora hydei]|uniref:Metallo-beta-lactamase domain-containing protein n=1 Tax=Apiospora hydei TaxID=1337664 RepID=A0ABR1WL28_9PEZI
MSTFDGVVHEFPDILIDYFRFRAPRPPPRLCLLSHVHSDHLAGLETLRGPFVYCSPATREMLLRLERYPCRINYANGTLEARKQTYRHLKHILKPIPLETPTKLELWPGQYVQVTLFDANHCVGAVMFRSKTDRGVFWLVIEGGGKAVLYTGDIRSEPWWVNSIAQNPSLVERWTASTVFFVQAWTYGYEDVWIALAKALDSKVSGLVAPPRQGHRCLLASLSDAVAKRKCEIQIHVDAYKMGICRSLVERTSADLFARQIHLAKEAPYLVGFSCANNQHDGCLTLDEHVRIHSCEKGTACAVVQNQPIVWIKPIVSRLPDGREVAEVGIGGGGGDLEREAELQCVTADNLDAVISMYVYAPDVRYVRASTNSKRQDPES